MRPTPAIRSSFIDLVNTVFPAYCHSCGRLADTGAWAPLLCRDCADSFPFWDRVVPVPRPLAGGYALSRFEGPAKDLLVALKYKGLLRAGWAFGGRMAAASEAKLWLQRSEIIVPLPLHWRRRWARGHNQAMTLVNGMVRNGHWGSACRALVRVRATRPQVGLGRRNRMANVSGAFAVHGRMAPRVRGARVLLVDDVVTTGATAAAAGTALKRAGAREIRLYAAAWAQPSSPAT
jgi:ComF family protein